MAEASMDDIDWEDVGEPANPLPLLQKWFAKHCNGDWEHDFGIQIETLDNPGWRIKINLIGTALEGKAFAPVEQNVGPSSEPSATSWMTCYVKDGTWNAAGDAKKLNTMLLTFLDWAADVDPGWPSR